MGVAEEARAFLRVAILRRFALRVEVLIAHPARSAGDVEGDDDAVTGAKVRDLLANLLNDPHRFVTEDVTLLQHESELGIEMQIGPADRGRRDAHDRIGWFLQTGIRDALNTDVFLAVPD